jgi:hypothetical protein
VVARAFTSPPACLTAIGEAILELGPFVGGAGGIITAINKRLKGSKISAKEFIFTPRDVFGEIGGRLDVKMG